MPPMRPLLASAAVYAALTLAIGWDVLDNVSTLIAADRGDPVLTASILSWNARHLPWTDAWYNFPIFHPATDALTFSEHLLGLGVIATPLYWVTGNALTTHNLTLLATYVLCGLAMFVLVWYLTRSAIASFVAGLLFAFAPYRVSQISHIQMLATFWAPLALLGLHQFVAAYRANAPGRTRALALFAAAWALQGASNGYLLVYFSVLVGLWILWFAVVHGRWRELAWIGAALVAAVVPLSPILLRYVSTHAAYGMSRQPEEVALYSADVSSIACAPPGLEVWGWLQAGVCGGEKELFPGLTLVAGVVLAGLAAPRMRPSRSVVRTVATLASLLLVVVGLAMMASSVAVARGGDWRWAWGPFVVSASSVDRHFTRGIVLLVIAAVVSPAARAAARRASIPAFYLIAAAVMLALTWGPAPQLFGRTALSQGPYAWLMMLPGVDGLRVPARFWMLTVLCLSVAVGLLLAAALRHRTRTVGAIVAAVALAGVVVDAWAIVPSARLMIPPPRPAAIAGGVALTLPLGVQPERELGAIMDAVEGRWTTVNGHSGYEPQSYAVLRGGSVRLDDGLFTALRSGGDLHVLVDENALGHVTFVERQPGVRFVAAGRDIRQYFMPKAGAPVPSAPQGRRLPVRAVSASCSTDQVGFVLDGDNASRWECGLQPGQEITADLGAVELVDQVVPAAGSFPNDWPRRLWVETSEDGSRWSDAWEGGVLAAAFAGFGTDPSAGRIVLSFSPRRARFLRLRLTDTDASTFWSVAELEVWSSATAASATRAR